MSAIVPAGGRVYLGGDFQTINNVVQPYLAAVDPATGALLAWDPDVNGGVTGIAAAGDSVVLAGQFSHVGVHYQPWLTSVTALTGAFDFSFRPQVSTVVDAITVVGPQVVLATGGGEINGRSVQGIVGVDRAAALCPSPRARVRRRSPGSRRPRMAGSGSPRPRPISFRPAISRSPRTRHRATRRHRHRHRLRRRLVVGVVAVRVPDIEVSLVVSSSVPAPKAVVEVRAGVVNHSPNLAGRGVRAEIVLLAGATLLGAPAVDTGPGCVGTATLDCFLDYLAPAKTSYVRFSINVGSAGTKVISIRATMSGVDANLANNSGALTLDVKAPPAAAPAPVPPRTPTTVVSPKNLTGTSKANTLRGGSAADRLSGLGGNDRLFGLGGNDRLLGGSGNDRLVGGSGRDVLLGGSGNDTIEARDKTRDTIDCGTGRDIVIADRIDTVARNCDVVRRR